MQQIPSDADFRRAFIAPKGKLIVSADYANQEGRVMADKAKDKDYIDFFNNGDGDVHKLLCTLNWVNSWKLLKDNHEPSLKYKNFLKVQRLGIDTIKIEYNIPTSAQLIEHYVTKKYVQRIHK